MNKGCFNTKPARTFFLSLTLAAVLPFANAQDAVNPCEILNESIDCSGAGLHGAEIGFKTIKLNGKRKNDPMVNVDEALTISTSVKYTKRAKAEVTTNFNGGCPPRVETKRIKPEAAVTYTATLDGNSYSGSGDSFTVNAPAAIGSYPLVVTFTGTAVNGCIDNAPLVESKTFILDVIDGAYILSVNALEGAAKTTVPNGAYLCKGQGQEIDLSVTFSSPLSSLPFSANDIVWTVTPTSAGDFSGPNGANGDSVTWTQADDYVSTEVDELTLTANAPNMQPKSIHLTVYGVNSTSGVLTTNDTQTFLIEDANVSPSSADKALIASLMNSAVTDVGQNDKIKLRTRTFTPPSNFQDLENEAFMPPEGDQANPALQIIKKATFSEVGGTLVVEIQSGPVTGDVNVTWERNRIGGRKILHREHMTVTSNDPLDTVTLVRDGTNDEGPLIWKAGDPALTIRAIPSAGMFEPNYPVWTINSNNPAPITIPDPEEETFPLGMLPAGEYTITAKIGDDPQEKDDFIVYVYQVDLDVDTNRDTNVNASDEAGEDAWTSSSGAIFAVNYDDDDANNGVDGMDFDDKGDPTNEDFTINGAGDEADIAPLLIPKVGSKSNAQFFLKLNAHDASAIHIFSGNTAGSGVLQIGAANATGWAAHMGTGSDVVIDITSVVQEQADVYLGIEGLFFPGGGVISAGYAFDGEVNIQLIAQSGTGNTAIIPANEIATDTVKLRVAPFYFLPNTIDANEIFLDDYSNATHPGADNIAAQFGSLSSRPAGTASSQWYQDHVQIGYTGLPGNTSYLTFRFPYKNEAGGSTYWQDTWPENVLFGPEKGLYRFRNTNRYDGGKSGDFGGNFEVVPYSDEWKRGRILHGDNVHSHLSAFFGAQLTDGALAVQEPIVVDTSWLNVGHVDEMVGFAPTPGTGSLRPYKVVRSDTQLAKTLLTTGTGSIMAPSDHAAIFASGLTKHGTAANAFTTPGKKYLFDGASHGYIKFIPPNDINDGETVTISDGTTSTTFEFEKTGGVTSGNVEVDISSASSTAGVRTEFWNVLKDTITTNGLQLGTEYDETTGVVIYNTDFGTAGDQTITHTVANGAFMTMGMTGGEPSGSGVDFTGMDDGWVRIYDETGEGQVAQIDEAGKGWLILKISTPKVFDTSTKVVWDVTGGIDGLFKYFTQYGGNVSKTNKWFTEPDTTSKYIVAQGTKFWRDFSAVEVPALWSVFELKNDASFWSFNTKAQAKINAAASAIKSGMGNYSGSSYLRTDGDTTDDSISGDADDDFISVPTIYFGAFNSGAFPGDIVDHTAEAFNPGLSNFQPASKTLMVFPKPYMAKNNSGEDIFEKACTNIFNSGTTRIYFVDDWNLYHRYKGEVHCGTAVKRNHHPTVWWETP